MSNQDVVDVLYNNLGCVPHEQYGAINVFPFVCDSDEINALKRQVAEGLASVLESAGQLATHAPDQPARSIKLQCRMCSTVLLTAGTDSHGVANVPAANLIATLSGLNLDCPHDKRSLEDQRKLIEAAIQEAQK